MNEIQLNLPTIFCLLLFSTVNFQMKTVILMMTRSNCFFDCAMQKGLIRKNINSTEYFHVHPYYACLFYFLFILVLSVDHFL